MSKNHIFLLFIILSIGRQVHSQKGFVSEVWQPDEGKGMYKNPIIHADYSDPDVVRVGSDFYMVASSFEDVPGIPILHSKDLVNWKLIGHALNHLVPRQHFSQVRHGEGVWAPSIRYYNDEFRIYYPDPDFGIYLVKSKSITGPWSEPVLVEPGKGFIDPCPLWDDDGKVYMVHAYAGSRAGIKSILVVKELNKAGEKVIDKGKIVFDGHDTDPTVEGPKFYKRNGWYYIFAPAGGVTKGWQLVLRSKNVYGPYERKVVLEQGSTNINGPHQGAWVNLAKGDDWFIHFQDKGAYGRIVHLQPVKWLNDWPLIGIDLDGNGIGEPVARHKKPDAGVIQTRYTPPDSDDFNGKSLGLQWQWPANPDPAWGFMYPAKGVLRLYAIDNKSQNLWDASNVLQQKFPAERFKATTKMEFNPNPLRYEKAGLAVMGIESAAIAVNKTKDGVFLNYITEIKGSYNEIIISKLDRDSIYLRIAVEEGGACRFGYSLDGENYTYTEESFKASPGKWKGAKLGLFCFGSGITNDRGFADFDWFKLSPL